MKKVLMVSHSRTPDKRIDQTSRSLVREGYEVYLACRGKKKDTIPDFYKEINYVHFNRKQMAYLPWAVKKIQRKYKELIERIKPDIIHANDLPAANAVRKVIPNNVKFIYDDHEVWELYYKLYADHTKNWFKRMQRRYLQIIAKFLTRKITKQANLIIFVNEHWVYYYEKKGININKMISLENFPSLKDIEKALKYDGPIDNFFLKDKRRKIVTASRDAKISDDTERDIDTIAEAVNELDDWVIVNFGLSDEKSEKLGIVSVGGKPRFEFMASCSKCDIVLNPSKLDELSNYCSSNRFFEATLLGVRVIATKVQTFVDKFNDAIIWVTPNTTIKEYKKILENIEDYPSGKEIKKIASKYIWENEEKKLLASYEKLLND